MGEEIMTVADIKQLRRKIDGEIQHAQALRDSRPEKGGREISIVVTKLQEAKMWCGKVLEEMGSELPKEFQDKAN